VSDTEERKQVIMEFLQRPLLSVYDYAVDEIVRLRAENAALTAAVERVRELHVRVQGKYFPAFCEHCDSMSYPCDTIAALEGTP